MSESHETPPLMASAVIKYIGSLSIVVYITGFVILTSHLNSYGISDFELLNFQLLKAGLCTIILFSPIIFVVRELYSNFSFQDEPSRILHACQLSVGVSFFIMPFVFESGGIEFYEISTIFMAIASISITFIRNTRVKIISIIAFLVITGIASLCFFLSVSENKGVFFYPFSFVFLIGLIINLIQPSRARTSGILEFMYPVALISILFFFSTFGRVVYKQIRTDFGGGMFIEKKMVFSESIPKAIISEFNPSEKVRLVYKNKESIFLLLKDSLTLEIPRKYIDSEISFY